MLSIEMNRLAKKAVQNPEILKPLTTLATSNSISALITSRKKPSVTSVNGRVRITSSGRRTALAALAEELLTRVSKVVGGSAFSERSPFAAWSQDVRALGYLRPPWGLAFDQLIAARWSQA